MSLKKFFIGFFLLSSLFLLSSQNCFALPSALGENPNDGQIKDFRNAVRNYFAEKNPLPTEAEAEKSCKRNYGNFTDKSWDQCSEVVGGITLKDNEKEDECKEAETKFETENNEFRRSCSAFTTERNCDNLVKACVLCPDGDEDEEADCVKVHKKSKCPQLSDKELKKAKDEIEKFKDKEKDLESDIKDLRADIVQEQGEGAEETNIFEEQKQKFQTDLVKIKKGLNDDLETGKKKLDASLEQAINKANKEIASSLKARHLFANSITQTHTKLRQEKNQVYSDCRSYAGQELASYRQKRRGAIAQGRFKQSSIKSLMRKNRVSFSQKDDARFKHHYNICLKNSRTQIKEIEAGHKESLKRIAQQKKEYLKRMSDLQKEVLVQTKNSLHGKNALANDYHKNLHNELLAFNSQERTRTENYERKQSSVSNKLKNKQNQLHKKRGELKNTKHRLYFNKELQNRLASKGADDSRSESFGTVLSNFDIRGSAFEKLIKTCNCTGAPSPPSDKPAGYNPSACINYKTEKNADGQIVLIKKGKWRKNRDIWEKRNGKQ